MIISKMKASSLAMVWLLLYLIIIHAVSFSIDSALVLFIL